MPTIEEMVKEYLEKNGYNGLVNPRCDCGCHLRDLFPCGQPGNCEAAYLVDCKYKYGHRDDEFEEMDCDGDCENCDGTLLTRVKPGENHDDD
jgi:hypothetical protein